MTTYLEIARMTPYPWCHPLLRALQANTKLAEKHKAWPTHKLSDLAFAIDGRLHAIRHLLRFIDEHLNQLGKVLERDRRVPKLVEGGYAYVFAVSDEEAIHRVLVGTVSFVREARSCFENLVDFRSEFLWHYVGGPVEKKQAQYTALNKVLRTPKWVDDLRDLRNDLSHDRYPWLAFKVRKRRLAKYEPVLVLNWRPGALGPTDRVPFSTLRRIRSGVNAAVKRLVEVLVKRVG